MRRLSKLLRTCALPAMMALYLLFIYLGTMAPGLSWANGGSDGGDLITAAATGGVAHPTGYPVYLLLARLFQLLPLGTLAFRTNLLSAMAMVGASLWIYAIVQRSASSRSGAHPQLAGVIAGLAFGLSGIAWSQAVITEVYALHAFFVGLTLYLVSDPSLNSHRGRKVFVIGLFLGMALSNHLTTALLTPAIIVLVANGRQKIVQAPGNPYGETWQFMWKDLLRSAAGMGITLSSYLLLPVWASKQPLVNWGNPMTLKSFWWLVTGKLYQDDLLHQAQWSIGDRVHEWASLLLQQFGVFGLILALIGILIFFAPEPLYFLTIWTAISASMFALSYHVVDWYIHLIPVYLVFAIWIGLGFAKLVEVLSLRGKISVYIVGIFCTIYIFGFSVSNWKQVDASDDRRAEEFGREVMSRLPERAIVFVDEDRTIFALWYFHFALGERPDLAIVAVDLLHFDWYRENLHFTYPSLAVPGPFPWPETIANANHLRAVCYVQYVDHAELDCSKPLPAP